MKKAPFPRYRIAVYFYCDEGVPRFGIQTKRAKGGAWLNCCLDTDPLLFRSAEPALVALEKLRAG